MLYQGDLLKKFKESNLAKVSFLKLLLKKNPLECFHQLTAYQQRRRIHRNFVEKGMCKQSGLFDHQNQVEKVSRNIVDISMKEITLKKARGSKVDFWTIEITSKKVRRNNFDFLTIEITSKKARGNDVDFSISKITLKMYVEMTWKFVEIQSSTYPRNIHVESASIRRGVLVGQTGRGGSDGSPGIFYFISFQ